MAFAPMTGGAGGVVLELSDDEERALSDLLYSVLELLATDADDDPVRLRWFPAAYPEDDAAAAEFRRFTHGDLTQAKRTAAVGALESLDAAPVDGVRRLTEPEALSWLAALNDIRLAFATRIGIGADEPEAESAQVSAEGSAEGAGGADEDDEVALAIYDWLTWLQETLVRSLP